MAKAKRTARAPVAQQTMKTTATTAPPSLETLEWLMDEALEVCQEMAELRRKLGTLQRGNEAYWDVETQIVVCADVIISKLKALLDEDDALLETMPDDDEAPGNQEPKAKSLRAEG
jgi:hypothetical protein